MEFGAALFFTDHSIGATELAPALEARGFESLWAPEHSHIPLSRRSPFPAGGELPRKYAEAIDLLRKCPCPSRPLADERNG